MPLKESKVSSLTLGGNFERIKRQPRFGFNTFGQVIPVPFRGGKRNLTLIAAMDKNRGIGKGNQIPWQLTPDMQQFRRLTMHHPVIMGRKTMESLPISKVAGTHHLDGRVNIVLTRQEKYVRGMNPLAVPVGSIDEALKLVGNRQAFVIGGSEIYHEFLPHVDDIILTQIQDYFLTDTTLPFFDRSAFDEVYSSHQFKTYSYRFSYFKRHQFEDIEL